MRIKKLTCLVLATGLLGVGCSTVKDVIGWHDATHREVAKFVSGVTPFRGNPDSHYLIACYYQDQGIIRRRSRSLRRPYRATRTM